MDKEPTPQPEPPPPLEGRAESPDWMWKFAIGCIILGAVIVLGMMLAGCAPPARVEIVAPWYQQVWDDARVPTDLWRGADHPEWATCRYEPPSALCTDKPVTN